jgi:hypothetical protein
MGYAQRNKERVITMRKPGKWELIYKDKSSETLIVEDWTKDQVTFGFMLAGKEGMTIIPVSELHKASFVPDSEERN